jgi:hypothetical protein
MADPLVLYEVDDKVGIVTLKLQHALLLVRRHRSFAAWYPLSLRDGP